MVESRALRYFVAVAEELHFGRAATRLSIAAPALSRSIAQLEAQLGVTLLKRNSRRVELTRAGASLLEEVRPALAAIDASVRRTQRMAQPEHRLVVALKADVEGGLLEPILASYGGPVEVMLCHWNEQVELVRDGRADVALILGPVEDPALDHEVLSEEAQFVALAAGHPLAEVRVLRLSDLDAGLRRTTRAHLWTPAGGPPPPIGDLAQLLWLVETGELAALLPESVAARYTRPQLTYRPVLDAPPASLAVAWPRASHSLATAAFVQAAVDVAAARSSRAAVRAAV